METLFIDEYEQKSNPSDILQLIDKDLLRCLLQGFSYKLETGITIVFKRCDSSGSPFFTRIDDDDECSRFKCYHPLCKWYRENNKNHEEKCKDCDNKNADWYYQNKSRTPRIYLCDLGLWDMSYPIFIDDNLVGVIFAGQIFIQRTFGLYIQTLINMEQKKRIHLDFNVNSLSQKELIEDNIKKDDDNTSIDVIIKKIQNSNSDNKFYHNIDQLLQRFENLEQFGIMLTELINKLHRLDIQSAQKDMIKRIDTELSRVTANCEADNFNGLWWDSLKYSIYVFRKVTQTGLFRIFYRLNSSYVEKFNANGPVLNNPVKFPANLIIPSESDLQPFHIADGTGGYRINPIVKEEITEYLDLTKDSYLFLSYNQRSMARSIRNILIICEDLKTSPQKDYMNFLSMFCDMLSIRIYIFEILMQIENERSDFANKVRRVSHHIKNTHQTSIAAIYKIRNMCLAKSEAYKETLFTLEQDLKMVKYEMEELFIKAQKIKLPYDILSIISDLVDEYTPLAELNRCTIELKKPGYPIRVDMNETEIYIALSNILDNAIKYSYEEHAINILVHDTGGEQVDIEISNYGIGIPEEQYENIKMEGIRGLVKDMEWLNKIRPGTGLGIPIAIQYIKNHKGTFNIESYAADSYERNPYHRYVTKAYISLPKYFRKE